MALNLVGTEIGYLAVVEKVGRRYVKSSKAYRTLWRCKCICGKEVVKQTQALRGDKASKTCGCCEWHIKHNEAYVSWMAMKQRCNDPNRKDYIYYGAKGITYDPRWEVFIEFFKDMGDPPKDTWTGERLSLERVDNNLNYCKDNCCWATRSEQQLNKR